MTNEEKANEICGGNWRVFNKEYAAALEMAEWKDQQFKEYLEKKLNEAVQKRNDSDYYEVYDLYDVQASVINEIINELFKNE